MMISSLPTAANTLSSEEKDKSMPKQPREVPWHRMRGTWHGPMNIECFDGLLVPIILRRCHIKVLFFAICQTIYVGLFSWNTRNLLGIYPSTRVSVLILTCLYWIKVHLVVVLDCCKFKNLYGNCRNMERDRHFLSLFLTKSIDK